MTSPAKYLSNDSKYIVDVACDQTFLTKHCYKRSDHTLNFTKV